MNLVQRYLLRHLVVATLALTLTLTLALWLTQSLRFLELAIESGAPIEAFLTVVALTLPGFLAIVLPIALLVVVLFVYAKMIADNELVVLRAAGLSHWALARPALVLATVVAAIVFVLNAWLAPMAKRELKTIVDILRSEYSDVLLQEGVFNSLGDGTTVFVNSRDLSGQMHGILIHMKKPGEPPITVFARSGWFVNTEVGPRVVVMNGTRQEFDRATGRLSRLEFDRHAIDLAQLGGDEVPGQRWLEADERPIWDLFKPPRTENDRRFYQQLIADAHNRLASPALAIGFTLVALIALLGGEFSRRGQSLRILSAVAIVVAIQGTTLALANLARANASAVPGLYAVALLPVIVGAVLLHQRCRRVARRDADAPV